MNRRTHAVLRVGALLLAVGALYRPDAAAQGNGGYYVSIVMPRGVPAGDAATLEREIAAGLRGRSDINWAPRGETPAQAVQVIAANSWTGRRVDILVAFVGAGRHLRVRAQVDVSEYPSGTRISRHVVSPAVSGGTGRNEQLLVCARAVVAVLERNSLRAH